MSSYFQKIVNHKGFTPFIVAVIVAAGILVGIQTFPTLDEAYSGLWETLNRIILGIFVLEIIVKMGALWPRPLDYFKDGWNIFDFTIVVVCFLPFDGEFVPVLRLFRLLRVIRLVTVVPRLQVLVGAILKSLPSMVYISILLFLLFYVYAVIGVMFFRDNDPIHFGNLWTSFLSLFRVVTLEDWTDIMYIQMYGSSTYDGYSQSAENLVIISKARPLLGAAYFVSFVLLGTMIMLNLVIGVVINSMDEAQKEIAERQMHELLRRHDEHGLAELAHDDKIEVLRRKLSEITDELEHLK